MNGHSVLVQPSILVSTKPQNPQVLREKLSMLGIQIFGIQELQHRASARSVCCSKPVLATVLPKEMKSALPHNLPSPHALPKVTSEMLLPSLS